MNCPNCGAVVKEGKFCNYCGAKLPDDTKRVEVNVNKRIEDVAEMKRADYETAESKFRQRQMREALLGRKIRRYACIILLAAAVVCYFLGSAVEPVNGWRAACLAGSMFGGIPLLGYVIYLLVTGKW